MPGHLVGRNANALYKVPNLYDIAFSWNPEVETKFYGRIIRLNGLRVEISRPVVEFGCGTGRVLKMLTGLGFKCVGVDLSSSMAQYAQQRCRHIPDLVIGDMKLPPFESGTFAAALSTLASINYLASMKAVTSHLQATSRVLVRDGVYILDFMVGIPRTRSESWEIRRKGTLYQVEWRITRVEGRKSKLHERIRIKLNGKVVLLHNATMTIIPPKEFSRAAKDSGFREQHWYWPFQQEPSRPPSGGRAVVVLKKMI